MEPNFGEWYRLVNANPDDDILDNRWQSIEAFTEDIDCKEILELARLFHGLKLKEIEFITKFRQAFLENDKSFRMKDNELELSVLAGSSLARIIKEQNDENALVAAYATICPSFQDKRDKTTVPDIISEARNCLGAFSANLRNTPKKIDTNKDLEELKAVLDGKDIALINPVLKKYLANLNTSFSSMWNYISILREDSDILWWLLGEWSRDYEKPLKEIGLPAVCIIVGKELSDLVSRMPGPFSAPAVIHKMISYSTDNTEETIAFSDALNKTDRDWRSDLISNSSDIFNLCPIFYGSQKSLETEGLEDWYPYFKSAFAIEATKSFKPLELALQVYEECLFVRLVRTLLEE